MASKVKVEADESAPDEFIPPETPQKRKVGRPSTGDKRKGATQTEAQRLASLHNLKILRMPRRNKATGRHQ